MTALEAKIGQMIMVGLKGEELSQEEESLLRDYPFGGFVLFARNVKAPRQILSLCRSLWQKRRSIPPLIAIDQEGGRVHRLPPPFTHFPPAAEVGRTKSADLAYEVGLATARELSAVGINLNFAPVLDVHSNPKNPIIGDRSYGPDPQEVARLGWSMLKGLRSGGVIPCGKHFPGHGDTSEDSHLELPIVGKDPFLLRSVELLPFIFACKREIDSLMTAHVLYPSLDPGYPATLSRPIITGLLRRELGYRGVVFGDDMGMKAISENYSLEGALGRAVEAGIDVLPFCHEIETAVRAFDILRDEAERKEEIRQRVEESCERIAGLKRRYLASFGGAREEELSRLVGSDEHRRVVEEIQRSL